MNFFKLTEKASIFSDSKTGVSITGDQVGNFPSLTRTLTDALRRGLVEKATEAEYKAYKATQKATAKGATANAAELEELRTAYAKLEDANQELDATNKELVAKVEELEAKVKTLDSKSTDPTGNLKPASK